MGSHAVTYFVHILKTENECLIKPFPASHGPKLCSSVTMIGLAYVYLLTGADSWFPNAGKIGVLGKYWLNKPTVSLIILRFPSCVWFHTSWAGISPVQST
jgi:hypothetical protein